MAEGVKYLHGLRPAPLAHGDLKAVRDCFTVRFLALIFFARLMSSSMH